MSEPPKKKAVAIPEDLYEQIQGAIKGKGFSTVDDYVTYFLRISFGKQPQKEEEGDDSKVIDQLKALGYI
ncbi:MAG: CopG family transcriptional regulator [Nitrososphaerales archaeon]|jgi:hypothetical protein